MLRRLGNKSKIAHKIIAQFPEHSIYIEPFFGAGGLFLNKPLAKYNFVNDLDNDVFNLYTVLQHNKEELIRELQLMPIHSSLFNHWKTNQETNPVLKAIRFLFLSNFSLFGANNTMIIEPGNPKKILLSDIERTFLKLQNVKFTGYDFKQFFHSLSEDCFTNKTFIYADPPYLGTSDNYSNSFKESDSNDLLNCLEKTGCKYAMSEFKHPFILEQAQKRNLNVITIGERRSLNNRNTEILITNYQNNKTLFCK